MIPGNQPLSQRFGVEEIQYQIMSALVADLAYYMAEEQTRGQTLDAQLATLTGRSFPAITLEAIDALHIHDGHRPSLINGPVGEWPAIAVMVFSLGPSAINTNIIGMRAGRVQCSIETIVKAGPYSTDDGQTSDGEEICNRRLNRTLEAINQCVLNHKELNGVALVVEQAPQVSWGEMYTVEDRDAPGDLKRYYYQGVRIQYAYDRLSLAFTTDQGP